MRVSRSRFLEYTASEIRDQLDSLADEAVAAMKSWPCLVMEEGRSEEPAFVSKIASLNLHESDLLLEFAPPTFADLQNGEIWKLRAQLDVEQFEFSRHHWAVKDRDLLQVLADEGKALPVALTSQFEHLRLPAPNRSSLIQIRNVISEWSHTQLDDLLLEAGAEGLIADQTVGSRRDRANKIINFTLENPGALTADGHLFAAFLDRAADPRREAGTITQVPRPSPPPTTSAVEVKRAARNPNRVFIVHGRDNAARRSISEFLAGLGLEGIVLHDQPNMGRHLLTKFIDEAELVTFAVVLMTADDVGGLPGSPLAPRARQNVILELGYFLAHLGQPKVCALVTPGLDTPSDFDGIVYIPMDSLAEWKRHLYRELRAAGLPVKRWDGDRDAD